MRLGPTVLCSGAMPRPRVVFLGTGGALNPERYQAAVLVESAGTHVLLDTGGGLGIVRRLLAAEIDPASIGHVFLSHRHLDHVGGLEPLLLTMWLNVIRANATPPAAVRLYALPGSAAAIRATLAAADAVGEQRLAGRLSWVTPEPGATCASTATWGSRYPPSITCPPAARRPAAWWTRAAPASSTAETRARAGRWPTPRAAPIY